MPIFEKWGDLKNLKIRFTYFGDDSQLSRVFLDAVWLEMETGVAQAPGPLIDQSQPDNDINSIDIFPGDINSDWFNKQTALVRDLQNISDFSSFDNKNSASPFKMSDSHSPQSGLPLAQVFNRILSVFRPFFAEAQDENSDTSTPSFLPTLPIINDVLPIDNNNTQQIGRAHV